MNSKINENFCILPFTHLNAKTNGKVSLCCRAMSQVGDIRRNSIANIWNSISIRKVRKKMLNGERVDMCQPCWDLEDKGIPSLRQRMNKNRKHLFWYIDRINDDFSMPFKIPIIELSLSNICNFRCRMCKPILSTSWFKDWEMVKDIYQSVGITYEKTGTNQKKMNYFNQNSFLQNIEQLGPYIETLEFAGGEPLLEPLHYKILDIISPWSKSIQLKYATNLSRLKVGQWDILKKWSEFKNLDLSVSVDGYPELNDYIRTDGKTRELVENIKKVKNSIKRLSIRGALCFSVYNVLRLPKCYDWFTRVLEIPVHGNYLDQPFFLNSRILPIEMKQLASKKNESIYKRSEERNILYLPDRMVQTNCLFYLQ